MKVHTEITHMEKFVADFDGYVLEATLKKPVGHKGFIVDEVSIVNAERRSILRAHFLKEVYAISKLCNALLEHQDTQK